MESPEHKEDIQNHVCGEDFERTEREEQEPMPPKEPCVRRKYAKFPFSPSDYLGVIRQTPIREDDVLIAGYPKTGNTMMEAIVTLILNGGDMADLNSNYNFVRTPFIDTFESETSNGCLRVQQNLSRTFRTHLPVDMIPQDVVDKRIRTIYVVRELKDTMVSLYHFLRSYIQLGKYEEDWNHFFDLIMSGELPYGHAADHYLGWWCNRRELNVLFVRYEDMVKNPRSVISSVSSFLDAPLEHDTVRDIAKATSFESMRRNDKLNLAPLTMAIDHSVSPFMRKGIVGDWKQQFTSKQARKFNQKFGEHIMELAPMLLNRY